MLNSALWDDLPNDTGDARSSDIYGWVLVRLSEVKNILLTKI